MAFKRFCDKCGAEIDIKDRINDDMYGLVISIRYPCQKIDDDGDDEDIFPERRYVDLCAVCNKKLENVVRRNLSDCLPTFPKEPKKSGKGAKKRD